MNPSPRTYQVDLTDGELIFEVSYATNGSIRRSSKISEDLRACGYFKDSPEVCDFIGLMLALTQNVTVVKDEVNPEQGRIDFWDFEDFWNYVIQFKTPSGDFVFTQEDAWAICEGFDNFVSDQVQSIWSRVYRLVEIRYPSSRTLAPSHRLTAAEKSDDDFLD